MHLFSELGFRNQGLKKIELCNTFPLLDSKLHLSGSKIETAIQTAKNKYLSFFLKETKVYSPF